MCGVVGEGRAALDVDVAIGVDCTCGDETHAGSTACSPFGRALRLFHVPTTAVCLLEAYIGVVGVARFLNGTSTAKYVDKREVVAMSNIVFTGNIRCFKRL